MENVGYAGNVYHVTAYSTFLQDFCHGKWRPCSTIYRNRLSKEALHVDRATHLEI